ncbi:class C sortase [Antribacter gilvus]|uniref:class C sortase n=1 Tax=Antribacter gilvus TaxID=2304675 RepID=UPI000F77A461|nr:class C sortase [Antribacter gilvus]
MNRQTVAVMVLAALGLGLLLYPTAANWFAVRDQASELTGYAHAVDAMPSAEQDAMLASAEAYNERLAQGRTGSGTTPDAEYQGELAPQPGDVMAQLTVPDLGVTLPVYHGTGEDSLSRGVGHLFGSALPVGGVGNHPVLSAHSGLVDAELFTHLEDLEIGDHFSIDVVGRTITYEVDQITVVEPGDTTTMQPEADRDLVTLLTCTPTGINSHRLAVRGVRLDPVPAADAEAVIAGRDGEAGFPWWAVAFVGGVTLAGVGGNRLSRPRKASRTAADQASAAQTPEGRAPANQHPKETPPVRTRRRRPDPVKIVALVVLLGGLAVAGGWTWHNVGTTWMADRQEAGDLAAFSEAHPLPAAAGTLRTDLDAAPVPTDLSGTWGTLWVPSWAGTTGARGELMDARTPIKEGVTEAVLNTGAAGRFTQSDRPGQVGNTALAGHRRTHGDNFLHVDALVAGDTVVVETADAWYVYEVTGPAGLVEPQQGAEVVADAPSGLAPGGRYLTLVSCHSVTDGAWGNDHRIVVHASLVGWLEHDAGVPPELAGALG